MSRRRVMMLLFSLSDLAKSFVDRVREGLGDELTTNGDFDGNADDWFLGSGWSYGNNRVSDISNSATFISQDITFVVGKTYKITYTTSNVLAGVVHSSIRGGGSSVSGSLIGESGTFTDYLESTGNDTFRITANEAFYGSIESVSIKEVKEGGIVESANCIDKKLKL